MVMISVCPSAGSGCFVDPLIKVVSASFSIVDFLIFPFVINEYFVEKYFEAI